MAGAKRLEARFAALKREGRAAFVAYIMAGDPDAETALDILRALPAAGVDIIELGFPFPTPWPKARRSSARRSGPWPPA